jgi:hypothetical protein
LILGEIKNKCVKVNFDGDQLEVIRFFGLSERMYNKTEIDGWKLSHQLYFNDRKEFILIMKGNETVALVSKVYHRNYGEIKNYLETHFDYLDYEGYSYLKEVKEMFKWH